MPRLFTGPVELSETATAGSSSQYIGTTLRLLFQISNDHSNKAQGIFPEIEIEISRVGAWHAWQQQEVWFNGYLVGTFQDSNPTTKIFPVQPRLLHVHPATNKWEVPQDKINELQIKLGSGGFGLNDSFDLHWIEFNNVLL